MDGAEQIQAPLARHAGRRRALWVAVAMLVVLVLILTPPLLNVNRLRRRIATSMSESLGRPVHMDRVNLNLLPVPGFTLQNLVVSEDPSFGAEPVIRANSVHATLRASSLWRRQVEFGTIRFEEPSVNLVRRADGRWNIESILLHAAQKDAAPTAQTKAGPAPRFPYIEATGARLNVKLGDEKIPFALTEADFALWLPSPQEWHVRLEARPTRTDTSVSDTGILTVEATLQRAARLPDVPVDLTAAWRRAPLGEASRILTGGDAGWRGNVEATLTAHGTLGDAVVNGKLKLSDVRRRDFIPGRTLSSETDCVAHLAVTLAVLREPSCIMPAGASKGVLAATADEVALTGMHASGVRVGMTQVPDAWLLDWARLFSQRIPATLSPQGSVSGSLVRAAAQKPTASRWRSGWEGDLHGTLHLRSPETPADRQSAGSPQGADRPFTIRSTGDGFALTPFTFDLPGKSLVALSGTINAEKLTLRLSGTATTQELAAFFAAMPPLADGAEQAIPAAVKDAAGPLPIDLTCTRAWGTPQTCVFVGAVPDTEKKPRAHIRH
jgi:hypothetical protein